MSHAEYADWLMTIGVGWLGLSPAEVGRSLISDLLLGYDGKLDMLRSCYGGGAPEKDLNDADAFDARFGDDEDDDESS